MMKNVDESLMELRRTNDAILGLSQRVTKLETDHKKIAKGVITSDQNIRQLFDQTDSIEQNSLRLQLILTCDLPRPVTTTPLSGTPEVQPTSDTPDQGQPQPLEGQPQSEQMALGIPTVTRLAKLQDLQSRVRQHLSTTLRLPSTTTVFMCVNSAIEHQISSI